MLREQVNSFARASQTPAQSYIVLPLDRSVDASDLEFREYAAYIAVVLESRGLRPVVTIDQADLMVLLAYGMEEPREHYFTYSTPEFGQTGVSSSTSTTNATVRGSQMNATTETTYQPSYGITGSTTHVASITTCPRWIILRAWDRYAMQSGQDTAEIWRTTLRSDGQTCDLRAVAPAMVAAARNAIGSNTGQALEVRIDLDADQIRWIKSARDAVLARPARRTQLAASPRKDSPPVPQSSAQPAPASGPTAPATIAPVAPDPPADTAAAGPAK